MAHAGDGARGNPIDAAAHGAIDIAGNIAIDASTNVAIDGASNVAEDGPAHVSRDGAVDVAINIPGDVPRNIARNIPIDVPGDIAGDIARNITVDIAGNVARNRSIDVAVDVPVDLAVDGGINVPIDVPVNIPVDNTAYIRVDVAIELGSGRGRRRDKIIRSNPGELERAAVSIGRDVERRAAEQADPIEIFRYGIVNVSVQSAELFVVKGAIRIGFGGILGQHGQLAHPIQRFPDLLQVTVPGLRIGDSISQVIDGGLGPGDLRVKPHRDSEARRIIHGRKDLGSGREPSQRPGEQSGRLLQESIARLRRRIRLNDHAIRP